MRRGQDLVPQRDVCRHGAPRVPAIAEREAWGANSTTWGQTAGRYPLIIAMIEARDALTRSVPPVWAVYHGCSAPSDPDGYLRPSLSLSSK